MKEKMALIIKFGVPVIVLLLSFWAVYLDKKHPSDAEFGAVGAGVVFIVLTASLLILYLIIGIIFWAVKGQNFIFLSALFSILTAIVFILALTMKSKIESFRTSNEYKIKSQKELDKNDNVIDSLTKMIRKNPNNWKVIEKRGFAYLNYRFIPAEQIVKAINDLQIAADNKTKNPEVYKTLLEKYAFRKEYKKTEYIYNLALKYAEEKSIVLSDEDSDFLTKEINKIRKTQEKTRIWEEKQLIKNKETVVLLTNEIESGESTSYNYVQRGIAYSSIQEYQKALSDYEKAIELDSENRTAQVQKAYVLIYLNRKEEAIQVLEFLIKKYPDSEKLFKKKINEMNP